ncbi:ATP-binding domain-containing protein [Brevibacterium sp. BRM-1]|uniref:HelD family protein n=1 Tax=Brevibacterium sp. BRM-1 TaxID=2999062 RepID=UPI00227EA6F8|nr:UvrD-helicase domain-containing protein [Brevibacterium sp. BRM-1]WAL41072.1 ATP-binding domain-containing protein [Brevibacterium sp. BRM-1]
MVSEETEIAHEQRSVDTVYARLDEVRAEVADKLAAVRAMEVGGNHQNRSERDAFASLYEDQLMRLRGAEEGLCFGRIDSRSGEATYIGRIGLSAADRTQLLMDWRAPASEPFYRATAADPDGIVRRRHIATRRRTVISVEDDVLDLSALDAAERGSLHGEGALIAALEEHRTGRMGDIVATIQSEQDRIIRKDLAGVVVVQGGPGTGKTAVALHRAAYLLYQHRRRIEKSGVLLVGPSTVFLKYIEQVLPSLGETGAVLLTPGQLVPGIEAALRDGPRTAAVKGDLRMARVIARAVKNYQRLPQADEELGVGKYRIVLTRAMAKAARDRARRTGSPHNRARETFASALLRSLAEELGRASGTELTEDTLPELLDDLRMSADVRRAVNSLWLPLSPIGVLEALYTKPRRLVAAADGILSFEDMARLRRAPGAELTVDDVPLIDEIAELIGTGARPAAGTSGAEREYAEAVLEMTGTDAMVSAEALARRYAETGDGASVAERAADDREWTYGHLVVDEAQELSPMQLRLLFRRVPSKSATLVGDLAQASDVDVERTWESVLAPHVGERFALEQLTVSYRTPGTIMRLANDLLGAYFPSLQTPDPVRAGTWEPLVEDFARPAEVPAALPAAVRDELALLGGGRVAVIAADAQVREAAEALAAAGDVDFGVGPAGIDHTVAVLSPYGAKGLEFDSVIIVEPARMAPAGDRQGIGELYVALTRSTARLRIMGSQPSVLTPFLAG